MAEDNGQNGAVDLSGLGSFDFAPSWTAGDKGVAKTGRGGFRDPDDERAPRETRAPRRFADRPFLLPVRVIHGKCLAFSSYSACVGP